MNNYQKQLVQSSFRHIVPIADRFANLFFNRLFELDSSLRPLFKGDLDQQAQKLITTLQLLLNSLDDLEKMIPGLQQLGKRHAEYGVQPDDYETVGTVLLWAFEQILGELFTDEVRQAWNLVYAFLADTMKEAAYQTKANPEK